MAFFVVLLYRLGTGSEINLNKNQKMFKNNTKSLWAMIIVLVALIAIMIVMQTQMLMILRDLKTSIIENLSWHASYEPLETSRDIMVENGLLKPL